MSGAIISHARARERETEEKENRTERLIPNYPERSLPVIVSLTHENFFDAVDYRRPSAEIYTTVFESNMEVHSI